jgi:voltage-gated potassium channel
MNPLQLPEQQALEHERAEIVQQLEDWLDLPMLVLSFVWLALFAILQRRGYANELISGLNPLLEADNF